MKDGADGRSASCPAIARKRTSRCRPRIISTAHFARLPKSTRYMAEPFKREVAVVALADIGRLLDSDKATLDVWMKKGGVTLRLQAPAGRSEDDLVPVPLRGGGRALGGAMSWAAPAKLLPFRKQVLSGLDTPPDVRVQRQVLAEPALGLNQKHGRACPTGRLDHGGATRARVACAGTYDSEYRLVQPATIGFVCGYSARIVGLSAGWSAKIRPHFYRRRRH